VRLGHCPAADAERLATAVSAAGLPARLGDLTAPAPSAAALLKHMAQDKKVQDGRLTLILLEGLGRAFTTSTVERDTLAAFLQDEGAR
jgi:3-dehydroquinate synthase